MDPQSSLTPTPASPPSISISSTPSPQGPHQKRRMWIFIGVGVAVVLVAIIVISLMTQGGQKNDSNKSEVAKAFTVGSSPYIEACSVVTEADFRKSFSLAGEETIGTIVHEGALLPANTSSEGDVTKLAPETNKDASTSDCNISLAPVPQAKRLTTIDTKVMQFTSEEKAASHLQGKRSFAGGNISTLPSFPSSSMLKLPSAEGAIHSIAATFLHKHVTVELSYLMADGETVDSVIPKFDTLAKLIAGNIDNKDVALRSSNATGHVTLLGKPFIDTCFNIGLQALAQKIENIEFNVQAMRVDQYGSLPGSSASADGLGSSCTLTFNTPQEREAQQATTSDGKSSKSSDLTQKQKYPHTLVIATNRYASMDDAKKILAARKAQQVRLSTPEQPVEVQDLKNLGEGGFVSHKKSEVPDFSIDGSGKRSIIQDNYIILKGSDLITINFQQTESSKTKPFIVKESMVASAYALFEAMLSK